jgi:hypothetical protein
MVDLFTIAGRDQKRTIATKNGKTALHVSTLRLQGSSQRQAFLAQKRFY